MVAIVFPFTMELIVVVLFTLLAVPVYVVTRVLELLEESAPGAVTGKLHRGGRR